MSILWATNGAVGFDNIQGQVESSTTAGNFDSTYVGSAMKLLYATFVHKHLSAGVAELWVHFEVKTAAFSTSIFARPVVYVGNVAANQHLFQIGMTNNVWKLEMWNGSAWVDAGTGTASPATNSKVTIDLHVKMASSGGVAEWFLDGSRVGTAFSGNTITTASTLLDRITFRNIYTNSGADDIFFSQMIAADESTIGAKLRQHDMTAVGALSQWTGDYTDFDAYGASGLNLTKFASSATADQIELAVLSDLPAGGDFQFKAVVMNVSAKKGTTGPQKINAALRSGGTDYFSPDLALDVGYVQRGHVWALDPNTGSNWTRAAIDALEAGVRSRA